MPKIEKQFLAREMQWLLWNVISLKGDSVLDLREICEKLGVVMQKLEEDIYYFHNEDQRQKMNYQFRYIQKK